MKNLIYAVLLAFLLPLSKPVASDAPSGQELSGSWTFLASEVAQSETLIKREFVSVVLLQLAEVSLGEAGIARRQAEILDATESNRLQNWAQGVESEAQRYLLLHDAVQSGARVEVILTENRGRQPLISVGGNIVMLSHPRPSAQTDLETFIVTDFCQRMDCLAIGNASGHAPSLAPLQNNDDAD